MLIKTSPEIIAKAKLIKLVILDVDGVLSEGSVILDQNGAEGKCFNVKDGTGISFLQKAGIMVAIISGRADQSARYRAQELNITEIFQNQKNKNLAYQTLREKYQLQNENIAYLGDDLIDLGPIRAAGLGAAPADAEEIVQQYADWITPRPGGKGAVRDLCNLILDAQQKLAAIVDYYVDIA